MGIPDAFTPGMRTFLPVAPHHRRTVWLGILTVLALAAGFYAYRTHATVPAPAPSAWTTP